MISFISPLLENSKKYNNTIDLNENCVNNVVPVKLYPNYDTMKEKILSDAKPIKENPEFIDGLIP